MVRQQEIVLCFITRFWFGGQSLVKESREKETQFSREKSFFLLLRSMAKGLFGWKIFPTLLWAWEKAFCFSDSPRFFFPSGNNKNTNRPRAIILRTHCAAKTCKRRRLPACIFGLGFSFCLCRGYCRKKIGSRRKFGDDIVMTYPSTAPLLTRKVKSEHNE